MNFFSNEVEEILKKIIDKKEKILKNFLTRFPSPLNADQITLIRILCVIPIIFFILKKDLTLALVFFILGGLSDLFDGPVARFSGKETDLGKMLDPFADKILIVITFIMLTINSSFSDLLFWFILTCELILFALGIMGKDLVLRKGLRRKIGANLWGKWKCLMQFCGIFFLFLNKMIISQTFFWIAAILAVSSIINHLIPEKKS